jgi:hypothetical protein
LELATQCWHLLWLPRVLFVSNEMELPSS